jgi:hypothetical protein
VSDDRPDLVRRLGVLTEMIHAIVYFSPEPQAAYAELGLRGYWRGYFASRAAPLGPVGPELVTALFAGFAPTMVARALPQVWSIARPEQVRSARLAGATAALQRLLRTDPAAPVAPSIAASIAPSIEAAAELTDRCVQALPLPGRPMAAAQAGLERPSDPLAALWHDCTVLREYRGDGHLIAVAASGLTWPEPHLLKGARAHPRLQELRGWDEGIWAEAADRMRGRDPGELEALTDTLAAPAYRVLGADGQDELAHLLEPLARATDADMPQPNPMGLPPL